MRAHILSIGSEITSGHNLDTNSQWISRRLADLGIDTVLHVSVADDMEDCANAFRAAMERADIVISTGGLGPTADDLTRECLGLVLDQPLYLDENSLATIQKMFADRQRPMPERNRVQAMFPKGTEPIANQWGTAPGIFADVKGKLVFCLPGVPKEMMPMFQASVVPILKKRAATGRVLLSHSLHSFGGGESAIEEKLGDLTRRGRWPEVGITASEATITLRIIAGGDDPVAVRAAIDKDAQFVRDALGDLVYGENEEPLHGVVARLLLENGLTVSSAESCTGGLFGHLLTEVSGISRAFLGGVISYSNEAKSKLLGVPAALIEEVGAVSPQVAEAMANGARKLFGSDLAIGITGIAGPDGGTAEKPVGLVYVALSHANGIEVMKYNWPSDRSSTKLRSARMALNMVRLHIQKTRKTGGVA